MKIEKLQIINKSENENPTQITFRFSKNSILDIVDLMPEVCLIDDKEIR